MQPTCIRDENLEKETPLRDDGDTLNFPPGGMEQEQFSSERNVVSFQSPKNPEPSPRRIDGREIPSAE